MSMQSTDEFISSAKAKETVKGKVNSDVYELISTLRKEMLE